MTLQHRPGFGQGRGFGLGHGLGHRLRAAFGGPTIRKGSPAVPPIHAPGLGPGPYTAATRAGLMRAGTVGANPTRPGAKVAGAAGDSIRRVGTVNPAGITRGGGPGTVNPSGNLRGGPGFGGGNGRGKAGRP